MELGCNGPKVLVNVVKGKVRDAYINDEPTELHLLNNSLQIPGETLDKCWIKTVSNEGDETERTCSTNQNTRGVTDTTSALPPPEPQTTPSTITVPSNITTSRMTPAPDSPKSEGQSHPAPSWILFLLALTAFVFVGPAFLIPYGMFMCYKHFTRQRQNNNEPTGEPNEDQDMQVVPHGRADPVSIPRPNGALYTQVPDQDNNTEHNLSLQNTQDSTYLETNIDALVLENRNGGDDTDSVSTPVCDRRASTQFHMSMAGQDDGPESDCPSHTVGQASTRSDLDTETQVTRNGYLGDGTDLASTPVLDRGGGKQCSIEIQNMTASYKPQKLSPGQC